VSNYLGPATVSAALRLALEDVLAADIGDFSFTVTLGRPEQPQGGLNPARVNVFLYQALPNAAWRNADLPTRSSGGQLLQCPRAALDLYYLLTFYGDDGDLQPQRLMGSSVSALHAQPVLTRARIEAARVHADYTFLQASDLGNEVEQVKFSPLALNLEELSKLWSVFFQQPYHLSLAYLASVVFVEPQDTPVRALPVHTRVVLALPSVDLAQALTPDLIAGLVLWLRSDTAVTYDADGLSAWDDQSGQASHAAQATSARRPALVAHALGQRPGLHFDGADDRLAIQALSYSGPLAGVTAFVLARGLGPAAQVAVSFDDQRYWELAWSDGAPNPRPRWLTTDTAAASHSLAAPTGVNDGRWHVVCGRFEAGAAPDKQLFIDGVEAAQANAHGGNSLGGGATRFGYLGVGSAAATAGGAVDAGGGFFAGDLGEVIVFNRALTADERRQVERYLKARYG
jgi:hypothetical protein